MKRNVLVVGCLLLVGGSFAQNIDQKLQNAFQQFEGDSQLKQAISSLYVIDAKTGNVIFDKNSQIGLAPASTQKIITAASAFELLGKDYRYKTIYSFEHGEISAHKLVVFGFGDPTFGSWRFKSTTDSSIFQELMSAIKEYPVKEIDAIVTVINGNTRITPGGWIYEDMGNYYGAGSACINWHENQYDISFIPGQKVNDRAEMIQDSNVLRRWKYIRNECTTGPLGSGDNAYIYPLPGSEAILIQGSVPLGEKKFTIAGADMVPMETFAFSFAHYAKANGLKIRQRYSVEEGHSNAADTLLMHQRFYTHYSPSLDSIIYWFLKKSINLYGEALVKTFAYEKQGFGSTDSGVVIVKDFWKQKGIDENELNIYDGSGLSPLNRVTTYSQVAILKYAKTKDWFPFFYDALPEYNGMKMKSGTIRGVKAFCGYQTAKDGNEYIFSFIINNYNGYTSEVVSKMYKVLDCLK